MAPIVATKYKATYLYMIKPQLESFFGQIIYPPLCFTAADAERWEEDPEDHHKRMAYHRVGLNRERSTFTQWKAEVESREEDLWGTFVSNWEQIRMVDLPGAQDYREEVKGVLRSNYPQIDLDFSGDTPS